MSFKSFRWMMPALLGASLAGYAQPKPQDLGPKIYEAQWVRTADLPADASSLIPFPWGSDPLADGEVEVRARGQVKVELKGAEAGASYELLACYLTLLSDRCARLGDVETDERGRANAVVPWPENRTGAHALFFVLRRAGAAMFVSGFHMPAGTPPGGGLPPGPPKPAPPKPEKPDVELKGVITAVGSGVFAVSGIPVYVNDATRFDGAVKKFEDLKPGMEVEVKGSPVAGGILATRVKAEGKA